MRQHFKPYFAKIFTAFLAISRTWVAVGAIGVGNHVRLGKCGESRGEEESCPGDGGSSDLRVQQQHEAKKPLTAAGTMCLYPIPGTIEWPIHPDIMTRMPHPLASAS